MTTNARTFTADSARWYFASGEPCYELAKKDGKGMKDPTLADARKLNLLPSVTTILKVLDKPALNDWKVEQGVLAVLTTPRQEGETDDAFVNRVLHVERVQDQERDAARDAGTAIHEALENYFLGKDVDPQWRPWIEPAAKEICARGELITAEKILIGQGYGGRTDLIQNCGFHRIYDWKTTKKLPEQKKGAWIDHRLQLSAYAGAYRLLLLASPPTPPEIQTSNVYISTVEQGAYVICDHEDWQTTFTNGFLPLVQYWQWLNDYRPKQ